MDTSSPAAFVNVELLPMFVGRRVRAVIQVTDPSSEFTGGRSTDGQHLTVKGLPPFPPTTFVEVMGVAETNRSIVADVWTDFGTSFDANNYNELCKLASGEFRSCFCRVCLPD